ncbi:hypothetical protein F7R91_04930 [Streptomyces luteolifulvus]|uniref:Uncharacterized protein n=1 Tax=Streptomyces luteolifulvus TaxID=2615112 RepID=A0A6H9V339_9ACTN|nr:hypothetical protein [Streptomyces luteolifulvus]KAB1149125.1 hypothetical protein F7R91_04930 [Streptomyces luteolifulvus]
MWNKRGFRMPEGAEIVSHQGDEFKVDVSVPLDEDGYLGRQCPECSMSFRMNGEDYKALPDDIELWCVYCGHHQEHSEFMTAQQRDRVMRAAGDLGMQIVSQALSDAFRGLSRGSSRRSGFSISYKEKPFYPRPLPGIDEERLARIRTCAGCQVRYAVFDEHRFCPVCGRLPAASVAFDALQAEMARLDALNAVADDAKAILREQGVFTRSWVDTIENVVGVVEALASAVFESAVTDAAARLRGKGNVFQRLDDMADLFVGAGYDDLRGILEPETWQRLIETWAARHVFTHNDGIVDEKYLRKVPTSSAQVGRRLVISEAICRRAVDDATSLCTALAELTV